MSDFFTATFILRSSPTNWTINNLKQDEVDRITTWFQTEGASLNFSSDNRLRLLLKQPETASVVFRRQQSKNPIQETTP